MPYALWDTRLGNRVATCATRDEALRVVQDLLLAAAGLPPDPLALTRADDDGADEVVAAGDLLIRLAYAADQGSMAD